MRHENMLDIKQAALVVIDMQESFRQHIPDFSELAARVALVAHAAQLLGVTLVVTEQYPKGLGRTASEIRAVLPEGFVFQATARGLTQRMPMIMTAGESAMFRLGPKMPEGMIIGARGPHGVMASDST